VRARRDGISRQKFGFEGGSENEPMKRLAAYAALIAVPTLIAGIYGMNFQHLPELEWKFGYAGAMGVMVAIDVYLFYRLRKAKWLQSPAGKTAAAAN
jgi:magnesium transporter